MQREVRRYPALYTPRHAHHPSPMLPAPQVAALATMVLCGTCYALVSTAMRIFKKFELLEGEVVSFSDFLRALPKADEQADEDFDEEELQYRAKDPQKAIV